MHRFWVFPLVLGFVGAVYPLLCMLETAWVTGYFSAPLGFAMPPNYLFQILMAASPYGVIVGLLVGVVAAAREMARFGVRDRKGMVATGRLLGNLWWLGCYAPGFYGGTFLVIIGLRKLGWPPASLNRGYISGAFFFGMGIVNLAAILWAATRTALSDDVLTPRVLRGKWRHSNRGIE